jgi:hypothetical protein
MNIICLKCQKTERFKGSHWLACNKFKPSNLLEEMAVQSIKLLIPSLEELVEQEKGQK